MAEALFCLPSLCRAAPFILQMIYKKWFLCFENKTATQSEFVKHWLRGIIIHPRFKRLKLGFILIKLFDPLVNFFPKMTL